MLHVVAKRLRCHANAFSREHQGTLTLPAMAALFADPSRPVLLDLGCARGAYLSELAMRHAATHNVLGIDIRAGAVESAAIAVSGLENAAALYCNVLCAQHLAALMALIGPRLDVALALFPDPNFKPRHQKRRAFGPALLEAVRQTPLRTIVFKSDVESVFESARDLVAQRADQWQLLGEPDAVAATQQWLGTTKTTRELLVLEHSAPIFRFVAQRR